ncbi:hypothetical protein OROHE_026250 [Orobanche hederae]
MSWTRSLHTMGHDRVQRSWAETRSMRWKVGDGRRIKVWNNPWLMDDETAFVQTPCPIGYEDMCVQELMEEDTRYWDEEQLGALLLPDDIRRILQTPIGPPGSVDKIIWSPVRTGICTDKLVYKVLTRMVSNQTLEVEGRWHLLWGLKVPPRVKDCLWRLSRNCLPHK